MKRFNIIIFLKFVPAFLVLWLLLFHPSFVIMFFQNLVKEIAAYINGKKPQEILITVLVILTLIWISVIFYKNKVNPFLVKHLDVTKNTYSHGKRRFMKDKERNKHFVLVDYMNNYTQGLIVDRYKQVYLNLGIIKVNLYKKKFFKFKEDKKKDNKKNKKEYKRIQKEEANFSKGNNKKKTKYTFKLINFKDMIFLNNDPIHTLILATSRVGKTAMWMLAQIDLFSMIKDEKQKPNIVVTDLKLELYNKSAKIMKKRGYEVLLINLNDFDKSNSYNPLELIKRELINIMNPIVNENEKIPNRIIEEVTNELELEEIKYSNCSIKEIHKFLNNQVNKTEDEYVGIKAALIKYKEKLLEDNIKSMGKVTQEIRNFSDGFIPPSKDEKGKFFVQNAQNFLNAFIYYLLEQCFIYDDYNKFNLYSLNVTIEELSQVGEDKEMKVVSILKEKTKLNFGFLTIPKTDNKDILATIKSEMSIFTDVSLGFMSSMNQVDIDEIIKGDKPYIIYLGIPVEKPEYNKYVSIFINQIINRSISYTKKNGKESLNRKIHILADEFGNMPPISAFVNKLTLCLSMGIQMSLLVQDLEQLTDVYSKVQKEIILGNIHQKTYLRSANVSSRKYFEELIGYTTRLLKNISGSEYDKLSKSTQEVKVPLVNADDLGLNPMGIGYSVIDKNLPMKVYYRPAWDYMLNQITSVEKELLERNLIVGHKDKQVKDIVWT
ncbi:type IV secretory system conjugative DNA transfer family protein [Mycobacterium sp.]|uniref:type IV secretory system conjugative DNA transfer family protein n=1 Tax=Mycobacterium sp. TaxID=1785 RepID=UPI003A8B01C4